MKQFLKKLATALFGPYEIYSIYRWRGPGNDAGTLTPLTVEDLAAASFPEINALTAYAGDEALCYGLHDDGELACACWYWFGERYRQERGFLPLGPREAKLIQITTAKEARGRALARRLIGESSAAMAGQGFETLYARIWRGHAASEKAFAAADWCKVATIATFHVFSQPMRLRIPAFK